MVHPVVIEQCEVWDVIYICTHMCVKRNFDNEREDHDHQKGLEGHAFQSMRWNISVGSGGFTIEKSVCSLTPSTKQVAQMILYAHTPRQIIIFDTML